MDRPGFFFCICPDAALLREYVERELIAPASSGALPPDVQTFWADEGLDRRFWDALTLLGMDGRSPRAGGAGRAAASRGCLEEAFRRARHAEIRGAGRILS